jgi:hypothetical protein
MPGMRSARTSSPSAKKGRKENSIHLYNILDYADNSDIAPEAQGALLLAQTADEMGGAGE